MLDIRFIRENPELVRENIRKKFQDKKLPSWTRCWSSMRSCARRRPRQTSFAPTATPFPRRSAC